MPEHLRVPEVNKLFLYEDGIALIFKPGVAFIATICQALPLTRLSGLWVYIRMGKESNQAMGAFE
ncbi:hypothetical protein D3C78_1063440 [compost metagenome]